MLTFARSVGLLTLTISRLPDGRGSGSVRRSASLTTRPENLPACLPRRDLPRRFLDMDAGAPADASAGAASAAAAAGSEPGSSPSSASAGYTNAVASRNAAPNVAARNIRLYSLLHLDGSGQPK